MVAQRWDDDGMLRLIGKSEPASPTPGVVFAVFWAAGFSFSRAELHVEVSDSTVDCKYRPAERARAVSWAAGLSFSRVECMLR